MNILRLIRNSIKYILEKLYIGFTIFNTVIFVLSIGVWHFAWIAMTVSILFSVQLIPNTPILTEEALGFKIFILGFTALTFGNFLHISIQNSFENKFLVRCIYKDYRLNRITKEELLIELKRLRKQFFLFKLN